MHHSCSHSLSFFGMCEPKPLFCSYATIILSIKGSNLDLSFDFLGLTNVEMEEVLCNAYRSVESAYFATIDEALVKRTNLQIQIPDVSAL